MFHSQNLYLFFIASLLLNLTPGNDMLYVASRTLAQGTKAGIISALGIFTGCFFHIIAAVLGLSFVIASSAYLFSIIKFLGAAYLLYLGVKAFVAKSDFNKELKELPGSDKIKLFQQGVITNALNPKVAIFFLSFLPQFVNPSSSLFRFELLTLGIWFSVQGTIILIIVAWVVGKTGNFMKHNKIFLNTQQKITGIILIILGIKIALTSPK